MKNVSSIKKCNFWKQFQKNKITIRKKRTIFAENRLRLNIESKLSLSSACAIFAENRLRLNIESKLSLSSACAIFTENRLRLPCRNQGIMAVT